MSKNRVQVDPRGTSFTFHAFLKEIGFEDHLEQEDKSIAYKQVSNIFPVSLDLMLAYQSPLTAALDVDRFWPYFYGCSDGFSSCFQGGQFYIYLDTFPDKTLIRVDAVFLAKILEFDLFGFEYFVCDVEFTSFLMETKRDMIFASGIFLDYFSDLKVS